MTRCAIYTRYSSTLQNASSLDDQERECRVYAERNGWEVVEIYSDAAISGGSGNRPGYQKLRSHARSGKFDVVLAEAIDRLSRRLADIAELHDELSFHDIRLFTKGQDEISKVHVAMMGMIAEQYNADLAEKTKRGQVGRILAGKTAGGRGYGYAIGEPGDRVIDQAKAKIVERIFRDYASGLSPREIAGRLNEEGIPGPTDMVWRDTTIRGQRDRGTGILNNDAYVGKLIYGRTAYRKNPKTGKRKAVPQPASKWEVTSVPELRIISDDLWDAVKTRQQLVATEMPRDVNGNALNRLHRKTHLLSGLVICGQCGGPMAITANGRYGCSAYRSSRSCNNARTIPRVEVERRVLSGLRQRLFDTNLVGEFVHEFEHQVRQLRKSQVDQAQVDRKRLVEIDTQIDRLVDAIAAGTATTSVTERIRQLEREQTELRTQVGLITENENVVTIPNVATVYKRRIECLIDGLSDKAIRQEAIEMIQSMIDSIVITPNESGFEIDLRGDLAGILTLMDTKTELPNTESAGSSLSVVAGVGFEPTTFRL
ncbi:MAG: recombinase family protein [Roseibium sp.]|uniref:recombinase family protein n=1 Tax=Alphaproteobacteria TaxID=28211 RepID=UPI00329833DA